MTGGRRDTTATDRRPPDLRLVAVAAATWLSAVVVLPLQAPVALLVGGSAAVVAVVVWGWSVRGGGWAGVVVALMLGVVCGSVATATRLAVRDAGSLTDAAGQRAQVTAEVVIRRDARLLDRAAAGPPTWLVPVRLRWFDPSAGTAAGRVRSGARLLVFADDPRWRRFLPGQRVRTDGRLGPARAGDLTAAVLSATGTPLPVGEPSAVQRLAGTVRAGLRSATDPLPEQPGGLLPGLAVGDDRALDPAVADDFTATGMAHLLAVSGSNVAIIVGVVVLLARGARAPPWLTAAVSAVVLAGYVVVCRPDPSVIRAGVMGAVALVALATGRPRAAVPALAATVTVLVVVDPALAVDAGFTMSVLATGGLLLLAPGWRDALRRRGVPPGAAEALAVPAAAQLAVSPVIAGLTGSVSLVAVVANLIAVPAVAPATVLAVLAAAVSPAWPAGAGFLAWLGSWPAWWLVLVARYGAAVPVATVRWPDGLPGAVTVAVLAVVLVLVLRHRRWRTAAAVVAAAAVVGALPVRLAAGGWPPDGTVVVACAVGQGDLLVLPVGGGGAVVVDTGPSVGAADRCLDDLGVSHVPLLVVSHFHADHVGGVEGVFRDRRVGAVLLPGLREPPAGYELVAGTAAAAGTPVRVARPGERYRAGEVRLTVLAPSGELTGTRSDPNNNSLVVRAERAGTRVLLAGDAEVELQQALLAAHPAAALRADILKLAHHGSGYQLPEFLATVRPRVVLVPVGADNRHGHPDPALLDGLSETARVLRTDTDGDIAATLGSSGLSVVTRAPSVPGG